MLKLDGEIVDPKEHAGATFSDYLITDGSAKGAGMAKKKLRGLGINVDTDEEIPDSLIAQQILGLQIWVEVGNEPQMSESVKGSGVYDKENRVFDANLNKEVTIQKLTVQAYTRHNVGTKATAPTAQAQAPVQQIQHQIAQPTQYAPQMQAPQGYPQQAYPQQYAPQMQAPQMQAPQGFVPGQQAAPQNFPQGTFPGYPVNGGQLGATPPWVPVQAPTEEAPKKGPGRPKKNAE